MKVGEQLREMWRQATGRALGLAPGQTGLEAEAERKTLALPQVTALYTPGSPYAESARTILAADRVHGAATFFGKHYGMMTGVLFRIKAILKALFTFRIPLFVALISGAKIDGSQSTIL